MRAVALDAYGGPEVLRIPGLEFAGVVEACGPRVTRWSPGDRVMGLLPGGGYAERVVTHERAALPVPEGLSLTEAAAIPEVWLTAYDALFRQAGLRAGEVCLVHAAASGVGTAALALAHDAGALAAGTTRHPAKVERLRALGPYAVVVVGPDGRFAEAVRAASGGRPVDVALDLVGAAYLPETLDLLAPQGRLVCIGLVGGARAELDLGLVMSRRLHLTGSTLRARPLEEKIALAQEFGRLVLPRFAAGRLRPVVDRVLPLAEAAQAHRLLEANEVVGKVVLQVRS
jgi:NADPH2:quinone reductase